MQLEIRAANQADLPAVLEILNELSAWGAVRGIAMEWPLPWPADYIAEIVETGEMFLAHRQGEPVATFALRSSDEEAWGHQPPDAFYVHHLGVRRTQSGRGVGGKALEWAAAYACSNGKSFLRLDCIAANSFLQKYYKQAGFTHVGYHYLPHDRGMICLFEKEIPMPQVLPFDKSIPDEQALKGGWA